MLTIKLEALEKVLNELGWYALAIRLYRPESRADCYKIWSDELIKEYLELHCGETEAKNILALVELEMENEEDKTS